jgi:hypothetical protein
MLKAVVTSAILALPTWAADKRCTRECDETVKAFEKTCAEQMKKIPAAVKHCGELGKQMVKECQDECDGKKKKSR